MSVILAALLFLNYNVGSARAGSYCAYYYSYYSLDDCDDSTDLNIGAIVGGVVGGIGGLGLLTTIIGILYSCFCKKNKTNPQAVTQNTPNVVVAHTSAGGFQNQPMAYPQPPGYSQQQGYPQQGYPQQGYPQQGNPQQGYPQGIAGVVQPPSGIQQGKQPPSI